MTTRKHSTVTASAARSSIGLEALAVLARGRAEGAGAGSGPRRWRPSHPAPAADTRWRPLAVLGAVTPGAPLPLSRCDGAIRDRGDRTMRTQLAALVVAAGVALTTACGATAAPGGPGAGAAGAGAATPAAPAGAQRVTVVVDNSMHFA